MDEPKSRNYDDLPKTQVAQDGDLSSGGSKSLFGFSDLRGFVILIVAILSIRSSVISPYHVPTPSMEPTIKIGDRLLAFKAAYDFRLPFTDVVLWSIAQPKHGDIIVFRYPKGPSDDHYVKRVVAVAGDEVRIENNVLFVNGSPQPLTPVSNDGLLSDVLDREKKELFSESLFDRQHMVLLDKTQPGSMISGDFPVGSASFKVQPNSVFVLGDNRDKSNDSRQWGEVPLSYVRGRALFVIWSVYDRGGSAWPELRFARFFMGFD